ncbi:repressor LexA [Pullulanibacillus pueri]|uniref:LexA repressor DNA-binding domain-containing protein n=1 Tax=Pullulanibacillus pueri TaxID=1437324 RepID=A0A8J3EMG0_9BACL|nr:transcriptional regulator [Pullulanibacillus pueri]MBM7681923.1 repressor LexA [Pullulanibacillus pueri]GGH83459.1 hypothetical protein GCM10007096_24360 [Pullulanibacillus pueri]
MELGKTSRRVLKAIAKLSSECGYPPTVQEIGDEVGLKSTSTVYGHLERLQKSGYISWQPAKPRTIRVLQED